MVREEREEEEERATSHRFFSLIHLLVTTLFRQLSFAFGRRRNQQELDRERLRVFVLSSISVLCFLCWTVESNLLLVDESEETIAERRVEGDADERV